MNSVSVQRGTTEWIKVSIILNIVGTIACHFVLGQVLCYLVKNEMFQTDGWGYKLSIFPPQKWPWLTSQAWYEFYAYSSPISSTSTTLASQLDNLP